MKVEKRKKPLQIKEFQWCKVTECGNIIKIMAAEKDISTGGVIKKLSKDKYLDTRSGEIKDYAHYENRADSKKSLARTMERLRDLINTNATDISKCRWITLTYAENMTDAKRLYNDFRKFNERGRKLYGRYEYIAVAEPQARGAWHMHILMIFPEKAPYIHNDKLRTEVWRKGFVRIEPLDDVDNVGAYLTAYLTDVEMTEEMTAEPEKIKVVEYEENGQKKSKRFIKGERLKMYPPGFNFYRFSKGIKKPKITHEFGSEAKKKVSGATLTYSKTIDITEDDFGFNNTLIYEYYNRARKECQGESADKTKIGN